MSNTTQKYQAQTVQAEKGLSIKEDGSPFVHVGGWDFVILFLAILLRFVIMAKGKIKELDAKKREFNFVKYFDFKHVFRWLAHTITALIGLLVFPEIFVHYIQPTYFKGLDIWTLFGSGIIGFLGYDIIRVIEKLSLPIVKKFGYKDE